MQSMAGNNPQRLRSSALVRLGRDAPIASKALHFNPATGKLEPEMPPWESDEDAMDDDGNAADLHNDFGADGDADEGIPNFGAAFVWPVAIQVDDTLSTEEWLLQSYRGAVQEDAVRPLEVLESGAVLLLAPVYDATPGQRVMGAEALRTGTQQLARINPFNIMEVQQLMCSDGTRFFNTCQNVHCARSQQDHQFFHNLMHSPNALHRTHAEVLGGRASLCDCADAAICALWGDVGHDVDLADEESFGSWFIAQEPGTFSRFDQDESLQGERVACDLHARTIGLSIAA
jgi:hypothetical protein